VNTYRITHRTTYGYDEEVGESFGRAHLLPRDRPGQTCLDAQVPVTPRPAELREHTDWFGNRATYFAVTPGHRRLSVLAESTVAVDARPPPSTTPAWDAVRDRLRGATEPLLLDARVYALPSPRLPVHAEVAAYARASFPAGRPVAEAALDLCGRIHRDFRYVTGSSTVGSTVPELLARGSGVCQDFAHLAVAGLRAMGLAARYVSGYLETTPPRGRPRMVGADASHAWASVCTGTDWLDFDPTNDQLVDASYVELAHGRDYADVPPLKGVIFADSTGSVMDVAVDMIRVDRG
jgi:transglutaminase-like putative cysteine protease